MRVDKIWNYIQRRTHPLYLDLFWLFWLHAHEKIETKRGEMILVGALGQSRQLWTCASAQPCPPFWMLPPGSALTKGQSRPFPALWAGLLFWLFVHSHLQLFFYMYEWCISVPVICTVVLGPGEATAG